MKQIFVSCFGLREKTFYKGTFFVAKKMFKESYNFTPKNLQWSGLF